MKKITLLITLIFLLTMFSSTSYADWTKAGAGLNGDTYYVDFERIRKHDGYVYFWSLTDFLKPQLKGSFSAKAYFQGDCKLFRFKLLSLDYFKEPMGRGTRVTATPHDKWVYAPPESSIEVTLKRVCEHAN